MKSIFDSKIIVIFFNKHKKFIIFVIIFILAFWLPLIVGDGTSKFTGDERRAAEKAVESTKDAYHTYMESPPIFLNFRIDYVRPISTKGKYSDCKNLYKVKEEYHTIFAFPIATYIHDVCID